jgi:hypothetical protein
MKKLAITLTLVLLLSGHANAIPFFDVLDTTYNVQNKIRLNIEYINGESEYLEIEHSETSDRPIYSLIEGVAETGTDFKVESFVGSGKLRSEIVAWPGSNAEDGIAYYDGQSRTNISTETVFRPNFNGSSPSISFYHNADYPYYNNEFSIIDNTLGIEIFNPVWDEVPDDELRFLTFDYSDWNLDHTYTLRMSLFGSTNSEGHHNYLSGSDFFSYAKVPEPSAIFFCIFISLGLFGIKQKYFYKNV